MRKNTGWSGVAGLRARASAALLLTALTLPASGQVNEKKYEGYFLVGQFGEICTMCEAVVLCAAGDRAPNGKAVPEAGTFTLYHLHTRTFWSQVATIWEWFIANFDSSLVAAGHSRPVTVHAVADGAWQAPATHEARVSLEPARLAFSDGREINRVNRLWRQSATTQELGSCQRLPLWDALAVIGAHTRPGAAP